MRIFALILASVLLAACQTVGSTAGGAHTISYSGGNGTTKEQAIVIAGAGNSMEGVPAEYAWIQHHLPGAKIRSQALLTGSRQYDLFEVELPSGETRQVYFDITSFFGKDW